MLDSQDLETISHALNKQEELLTTLIEFIESTLVPGRSDAAKREVALDGLYRQLLKIQTVQLRVAEESARLAEQESQGQDE
jgi:hypothetical protein